MHKSFKIVFDKKIDGHIINIVVFLVES